MQMFTRIVVTACLSGYLLTACSMYDFWNGIYSDAAAVKNANKKRSDYYDKETPQQKEIRRINDITCSDKYGEDIIHPDGMRGWKGDINEYIKCMREKGSPLFGH